ncbi:hypoxanthine-guanine phosphoribosyltransferase [Marinobacterium marinum]|uniref:Hypoxanthine-guanine phosphoribosyltransferase n=1 Tax=Marinobacterium marinum TaxID=2756129 RepID=A0A7W2AAU5_9GAMM|nr:hypoxanthine-guanine phosphoribosyltransferase [Marinobacterium marinum]MBA4501405.1 hypoxanthine-guanine phosphoribosyltransferase [Marinobacterium marinum]
MSNITADEIKKVYIEADLLYSQSEVDAAISRMAAAITDDLHDKDPVVFAVMNGGLVIAGQLLTRLNFPLTASYLHATRYRGETTGQSLEWKVPPMVDFKDRPVLVVDDILDEGHTLIEVMAALKAEGAASVQCAVLVDKRHDRKATPGLKADFTGIEIEDRYIFGYGMDYKGYWRNAPGIFAVKGM